MFGHYVHHAPSFGGAQEKKTLVEQQKNMLHAYKAEFNSDPGPLSCFVSHSVYPVWAASLYSHT